jgi:hypothetical protein
VCRVGAFMDIGLHRGGLVGIGRADAIRQLAHLPIPAIVERSPSPRHSTRPSPYLATEPHLPCEYAECRFRFAFRKDTSCVDSLSAAALCRPTFSKRAMKKPLVSA